MDRFSWISSNTQLQAGELLVIQQRGLRIYDGENKTNFDNGNVMLTSHALIWEDEEQQDRRIRLGLELITRTEEHAAGFMKSAKIFLYLNPPLASKDPGPFSSSAFTYIKLSFRSGGHTEFHKLLEQQLQKKAWLQGKPKEVVAPRVHRRGPGIVGIERNLEEKSRATDKTITQAFKDLDALMEKAKEMVALADKFASKIEEKKGSITEDETILFKSYLLSVGISNPVTRETHGSGTTYHNELAKQLEIFLREQLKDAGGMMTLTDVYCRFNRARGMELVSPEDLVNASRQFESLNLPLRLRSFDSGVLVIQSSNHSDEEVIRDTREKLFSNKCLTADELSKILSLSVMLAKERLLVTEKAGKACRDDSVEEDLVNASRQFESLNLPLRLRSFDSGVLVIQSSNHSDEEVIRDTREKLFSNKCLTADELSKILSLSVMLAKERLLVTEKAGKACRDDSVEGLKCYPNLFLETSVE